MQRRQVVMALLGISVLLAAALAESQLRLTPQRARTQLQSRGIDFTEEQFVSRWFDPKTVELFLVAGMAPNAQEAKTGYTALHRLAIGYSLSEEKIASARLLLKHGANVDAKSLAGQNLTPLQALTTMPLLLPHTPERERAEIALLNVLLEYGADPNARDVRWSTPLIGAVSTGRYYLARELLKNKAVDLSLTNKRGETALMAMVAPFLFSSAKLGDPSKTIEELVQLYLKRGGNLYALDGNKRSALFHAVRYPSVVKLLLERGLPANQRDLYDKTPLMAAADAGNAATIEILIGAGADVNAVDTYEHTAFTLVLAGFIRTAMLETLVGDAKPGEEPIMGSVSFAEAVRVLSANGASYTDSREKWVKDQLKVIQRLNSQ